MDIAYIARVEAGVGREALGQVHGGVEESFELGLVKELLVCYS